MILSMILSYSGTLAFMTGDGIAYVNAETAASQSDEVSAQASDSDTAESAGSEGDEKSGASNGSADPKNGGDAKNDAGSNDSADSKDSGDSAGSNDGDTSTEDQSGESGDGASDDAADAEPEVITPEAEQVDVTHEDVATELREIEAEVIAAPVYTKDSEGNKKPSDAFKKARSFWKSLMGRKPDPAEDQDKAPVKVTVKGYLPKKATAEVQYIKLDEPKTHSETAQTYFELIIYDKDDNIFIPTEPLEVTVSGSAVKAAAADESSVMLYAFTPDPKRAKKYKKKYGKKYYAADVTVYRDGTGDDARRAYKTYSKKKTYKNGEDAVRYKEDKTGLKVNDDRDGLEFEYKFKQSSKVFRTGIARFLLSSQTAVKTLSASEGGTKAVSVK